MCGSAEGPTPEQLERDYWLGFLSHSLLWKRKDVVFNGRRWIPWPDALCLVPRRFREDPSFVVEAYERAGEAP